MLLLGITKPRSASLQEFFFNLLEVGKLCMTSNLEFQIFEFMSDAAPSADQLHSDAETEKLALAAAEAN
jgi:hypothetical protein